MSFSVRRSVAIFASPLCLTVRGREDSKWFNRIKSKKMVLTLGLRLSFYIIPPMPPTKEEEIDFWYWGISPVFLGSYFFNQPGNFWGVWCDLVLGSKKSWVAIESRAKWVVISTRKCMMAKKWSFFLFCTLNWKTKGWSKAQRSIVRTRMIRPTGGRVLLKGTNSQDAATWIWDRLYNI